MSRKNASVILLTDCKQSQFEGVNVCINTKKNKKGIHGSPLKLQPLGVDERRLYPYLKDWKMA